MKKRKLIVANWKMNPPTSVEAKSIALSTRNSSVKLKNTDVVICPPVPFISIIANTKRPIKNVFLGAQDVFSENKGAFTGSVSISMVKDLGAKFVIVGHSERRAAGDTNQIVNKKLNIIFNSNMTPVLCVGEKEKDDDGSHLDFLKNQIRESLSGLPKKFLIGIFIAYEPIWAIGKTYKEASNPTDIHESVLFIRKVLSEFFGRDIATSARILYGGSVEAENAKDIIEHGNVEGFVVGHASLDKNQIDSILQAVDHAK